MSDCLITENHDIIMTSVELSMTWERFSNRLDLSFENFNDLRDQIPRSPGVYRIYTDAPSEFLSRFDGRNDSAHTNLQRRINLTSTIPDRNRIIQVGNTPYCVYNGHTVTLRQRAVEHFLGSAGTYGLAIFELEELRNHQWSFEFLNLGLVDEYVDSETYRTCIEQVDRNKIGWPILCAK